MAKKKLPTLEELNSNLDNKLPTLDELNSGLKKKDPTLVDSEKPVEPLKTLGVNPENLLFELPQEKQDNTAPINVNIKEVNTKRESQSKLIKKTIDENFNDIKSEDPELIEDALRNNIIQKTGNHSLANEAVKYVREKKNNDIIIETEVAPIIIPEDQQQVKDKLNELTNRQLLGDNFKEIVERSKEETNNDIINDDKVIADYKNYLSKTDEDKWKNAEEGRYDGDSKEALEFYSEGLTHQAKLNNLKVERGLVEPERYIAEKRALESKFRDKLERFPEYKEIVDEAVKTQLDLNITYDQAKNDIVNGDALEKVEAAHVLSYYNVVAPAAAAFTKFGTGVISSLGRLESVAMTDDMSRNFNNFIDDFDKYMDIEKTNSIYKAPEQLKGQLFSEGEINTELILPKLSETAASMVALIHGGSIAEAAYIGAGAKLAPKLGLFTSSFLSTQNDYYVDARNEGMNHNQAMGYSTTASTEQALLELISPQNYIKGVNKSGVSAKMVKEIAAGKSTTQVVKDNFKFTLKEILKENIQEESQTLADNINNYAFNKYTGTNMKTTTTLDEHLETIALTTIVAGLGSVNGYTSSNQTRTDAFYLAMKNDEDFSNVVNDKNTFNKYGEDNVRRAKAELKAYTDTYNVLPSDMSEGVKASLSTALIDKKRIEQEISKREAIDERVVNKDVTKLQEQLSIINKQIDNLTGTQQTVKSETKKEETVKKEVKLSPEEEIQRNEAFKQREEESSSESKLGYKDQFIHDNLGRIKSSDFDHYSDKTNREGNNSALNVKYFKKDAMPLDSQVQSMSEDAGIEITPQDIVDYINDREANPEKYLKVKEVKKDTQETKPQEMSDEMKDWLGEDSDSIEPQFHRGVSDIIEEYKGKDLPKKNLKDAIAEFIKTKDVDAALAKINTTEWYKELTEKQQYTFNYDFKKGLGEDVSDLKKPKNDEEINPKVVKRARTILKDRIKEIEVSIKKGAKIGKDKVKAIQSEFRNYAKENLPKDKFTTGEVNKILTSIENATTEKGIQKAVERINEIVKTHEKKALQAKIDKKLDPKKYKKKGGKTPQGKKVDAETNKLLSNINKAANRKSEISAKEQIELDELLLKEDKTQQDVERVYELSAIGSYKYKTISELSRLNDTIDYILDGGIQKLNAKNEAKNKAYNERAQQVFEAIMNDETLDDTNTKTEKDKTISELEGIFNRAKENIAGFKTYVLGDLNWMVNYFNRSKDRKALQWIEKSMRNSQSDFITIKGQKAREIEKNLNDIFGKKPLDKLNKVGLKGTYSLVGEDSVEPVTMERNIFNDDLVKLYNWTRDITLSETLSGMDPKGEFFNDVVKTIESDPQLKEYADWSLDYYNDFYKKVNEVYSEVNNIDLPQNDTYSPVKKKSSSKKEISSILDGQAPNTATITNNLISRVDNTSPLMIDGGNLEIMRQYTNDMSRYVAYEIPVRNIKKLFTNNRFDIKKAIETKFGKLPAKLFEGMVDDLSAGAHLADTQSGAFKFLDGLRRRFTSTALGANLTLFPKQLTSILAYAGEEGVHSGRWMGEFLKSPMRYAQMAKYLKDGKPGAGKDFYDDLNLILNNEEIKDRYDTGFDRDIALMWADKAKNLQKENSKTKGVIGMLKRGQDKASNILMYPTIFGDKTAIIIGGLPTYRIEYQKQKNKNKSEAESRKLALEKFIETTKTSQQSREIQDLSAIQRGGSVVKVLTMFKTTPLQYYRKNSIAMNNIARGRGTKSDLKRLAIYRILLPALFQIAVQGGWDTEDEEDNQNMMIAVALGNLSAIPFLGDAVSGAFKKSLGADFFGLATSPVLSNFEKAIKKIKSDPDTYFSIDEEDRLQFFLLLSSAITTLPLENIRKKGYEAFGKADEDWRYLLGYSDYALGSGKSTGSKQTTKTKTRTVTSRTSRKKESR
jgi:hypothetical protein